MRKYNDRHLFAVVMAGGQGTRFWPESTSKKPKQYLNLTGEESLLGKTLKRFDGLIAEERRFVVTVEAQEKLASQAAQGKMNKQGLIFEPSGRNTAPAILLSIAYLESLGAQEDDIVALFPADHVILNEKGFRATVEKAAEAASNSENIVTIGIRPNYPHTGFGYIHRQEEERPGVYKVSSFKEKPSVDMAKEYVASGEYYWNAGMFVAKLKTLKNEFQNCSPETFESYPELLTAIGDKEKVASAYEKFPKDSIDYAVMEKSSNVMVVAADFDWNDLGSWDALEAVLEPKEGNTLVDERAYFIKESKGNIVFAPHKHVSLIGVNNLIVVANEQSVVVLPKERSQEIKEVVSSLKENSDLADLL